MNRICGIHSPRDPAQASAAMLESMLSALPLEGGAVHTLVDPESGVAMGVVSLSADAKGTPPFADAWYDNGSTVAALDGFLVGDAGSDHSRGRTPAARVVVDSLEKSAARFPAELSGHFGLAAWSRHTRTLQLARDPLGSHSLYHFHDPATGLSVFSSELKGILPHPAVSRRIDREALAAVMAFGYLPAPLCLFRGIRKMLPGELVQLDARGTATASRYWNVPPYAPQSVDVGELVEQARRIVLERFERYVEGHERVGLFLSGGIDSTVALGILKLLGVPDLRSYAFGCRIGAPRLCEDLVWAERAAAALGSRHQSVVIEPGHDPVPLLTEVWGYFDDPVLSPNVYTRFLLARAARRDGTFVCAGGSTGGSLFGAAADDSLAELFQKAGTQDPFELMTFRYNRIFPFGDIDDLLGELPGSPSRIALDVVRRNTAELNAETVGDRMKLATMLVTGAEKSVATQHRCSRLAGVDMRQPFRDASLLAFSRTIPFDLKGRRDPAMSKHVLKSAFRDVLPAEILARKKIGYPTYYWTGGELEPLVKRLLSHEAVERAGLFSPDAVQRVLREDRASPKKSAGKRTWALLSMQAWHAFHVEGCNGF